jgi:hypothetical protein
LLLPCARWCQWLKIVLETSPFGLGRKGSMVTRHAIRSSWLSHLSAALTRQRPRSRPGEQLRPLAGVVSRWRPRRLRREARRPPHGRTQLPCVVALPCPSARPRMPGLRLTGSRAPACVWFLLLSPADRCRCPPAHPSRRYPKPMRSRAARVRERRREVRTFRSRCWRTHRPCRRRVGSVVSPTAAWGRSPGGMPRCPPRQGSGHLHVPSCS